MEPKARKLDGRARAVAGEHVVRATLMSSFTMCHAADDRQLVHDFRDVLELLTHIFPWNGGLNRGVGPTIVWAEAKGFGSQDSC